MIQYTPIGTDQNFDLLKTESHKQTAALLNNAFANSLLPTITKPTRITHSSAILIRRGSRGGQGGLGPQKTTHRKKRIKIGQPRSKIQAKTYPKTH